MARRAVAETHLIGEWPEGPLVQGAPLEPLRYVERLLTRPDGTEVVVRVPVFPSFRLATWPPSAEEARHLGAPPPEAPAVRESEGPGQEFLELEEDAA